MQNLIKVILCPRMYCIYWKFYNLPFCTLILGKTGLMRMIDEEVSMKEKPEDTRYIKLQECGKTKYKGIDSQFYANFENLGNGQVVTNWLGPVRWNTYIGTPTKGLLFCYTILCPGGRGPTDHHPGLLSRLFLRHPGWGVIIITNI